VIAGLVTSALSLYVMLRVDPNTVLSSCSAVSTTVSGITRSGPQICPPGDRWAVLPDVTGVLGAAAVGMALVVRRRRRGHSQNIGTSVDLISH
jgi:MYXO-CTERM domain-containing protein